MITMAVDTAAHICGACIFDDVDGLVLAQAEEDIGRGHAERLFPLIQTALSKAQLTFEDLDRLGVNIGPGSFTGIRVGVSAMRGLALALDLPLVGVTIFEGLADETQIGQPLLVVLDARRDQVYAQLFDRFGRAAQACKAISPDEALRIANQAGAQLTGSGSNILLEAVPTGDEPPHVLETRSTLGIVTLARLAALKVPGDERPKPLYLRSADAKPQLGFALPRQGAVQ